MNLKLPQPEIKFRLDQADFFENDPINLVFQRPSKKGIKSAMRMEEEFITGEEGLGMQILNQMKPVQNKFDKEKYA